MSKPKKIELDDATLLAFSIIHEQIEKSGGDADEAGALPEELRIQISMLNAHAVRKVNLLPWPPPSVAPLPIRKITPR